MCTHRTLYYRDGLLVSVLMSSSPRFEQCVIRKGFVEENTDFPLCGCINAITNRTLSVPFISVTSRSPRSLRP